MEVRSTKKSQQQLFRGYRRQQKLVRTLGGVLAKRRQAAVQIVSHSEGSNRASKINVFLKSVFLKALVSNCIR